MKPCPSIWVIIISPIYSGVSRMGLLTYILRAIVHYRVARISFSDSNHPTVVVFYYYYLLTRFKILHLFLQEQCEWDPSSVRLEYLSVTREKYGHLQLICNYRRILPCAFSVCFWFFQTLFVLLIATRSHRHFLTALNWCSFGLSY